MIKFNVGAVAFVMACCFLSLPAVHAREVAIAGPVGALSVGQTATFTVTDQAFEDQCDSVLGYCASDFVVAYDRTVLEYVGTDYAGPVLLDPVLDLFTAPGLGDADPAGFVNVQLMLTSALPTGPSDVFYINFKAIGVSGLSASNVSVSPLSGAPSYMFQSAVSSVSVVPEPSTTLMISAALFVSLMALRRQR